MEFTLVKETSMSNNPGMCNKKGIKSKIRTHRRKECSIKNFSMVKSSSASDYSSSGVGCRDVADTRKMSHGKYTKEFGNAEMD